MDLQATLSDINILLNCLAYIPAVVMLMVLVPLVLTPVWAPPVIAYKVVRKLLK